MAPVRNLRGIGNTKPIPVIHFIPPVFAPVWKIDVVTDTETIDITDLLVEGSYLDGVTSSIGDFEFKILDPSNTYTNRIEEFDTVNVYLDYGKTATTLRFTGKIEKKSSQDQIYLTLTGRSIAMLTTGTNITYSSNGPKARSEILKDIINTKESDGVTPKYFGGLISDAGIEDDLTEIEVNYEEIPFWNIVEEICISGGRDAYINPSLVFNYFLKGSRENSTEAVVEDINLVETFDYAKDTEEVYTKVRIYGKKTGDIPIIATSTPDTTNTKGIIKELKLDNSSVDSTTQATELAESEAADKKLPPTIGSIISLMLPSLLPGEKLKIANPTNNIPPAAYQINSFRQIFSSTESPKTELIIQKQKVDLSTILKSNIKFQSDIPDNVNQFDMDFSNVISFESDSGVHSNTVINEGFLKVKIGQNSGSWTSDLIELDDDVSAIEFRFTGDYLVQQYGATTSYIWFSLDGGTTWRIYSSETVEVPTGRDLKIRIDLNAPDARVKAVSVLYKFN
jgi:hypothetical protein